MAAKRLRSVPKRRGPKNLVCAFASPARIEEAGRNANPQNRESTGSSRAAAASEKTTDRIESVTAVADGRVIGSRIDLLA